MRKLINKIKGKASPTGPRPFAEIEREYQQLSAQAANAQYKVYVHSEELKLVNRRLTEVNREAGERQALDAKVKEELAKKAPVDQPLDLTKSGAV